MSAPPNEPNETVTQMRLRPKPKPVLRLSRKMLIGLGAGGGIGLAAALGFAIAPPAAKPAKTDASAAAAIPARPSTEALNALPKDYTGTPKLGPPLPGDLGRPLLAAQQGPSGAVVPDTAVAGGFVTAPPAVAPQTEAAQVRQAAHASQIFFAQAGGAAPTVPDTPAPPPNPMAELASWTVPAVPGPPAVKSEAERKRAFLAQASAPQPVSPQRLTDPASPYLLSTGSVVPAALITGIRSDVPGQVLAQVTQDVRDSLTGRYLLIPKGARLIGQYDNAISFGQSRLLLTWQRLILPNGKSLLLENLSAANAQGYAGLQDRTDYHWSGIVGAVAVSTLLAMGAQSGDPKGDSALLRALRDGAADSVNRAGQQIVERQLTIQPTLTIRPGLPVRVILSRDLVLEPYGD